MQNLRHYQGLPALIEPGFGLAKALDDARPTTAPAPPADVALLADTRPQESVPINAKLPAWANGRGFGGNHGDGQTSAPEAPESAGTSISASERTSRVRPFNDHPQLREIRPQP